MESASNFAYFGAASEESVSEGELDQDFELPQILEEDQLMESSIQVARQRSISPPQYRSANSGLQMESEPRVTRAGEEY